MGGKIGENFVYEESLFFINNLTGKRKVYMERPEFVSVHGGHSGEFCSHATDSLEDVIQSYIEKGFAWVGITEHVPAISNDLLYPNQKEAGLDAETLYVEFAEYIKKCRELQAKYASQIKVYVGAETETYSGYETFIPGLIEKFKPDYVVGSIHHVDDMGIDYSAEQYGETAHALGGVDAMYERYFDQQYEMISHLRPAVVGHFDLVRIFDPDYRSRLEKPSIRERVTRNLKRVRELDLILDFDLRSLYKGADEPYITESILRQALEMGIAVVPGDDSHGVSTVGLNMETGVAILQDMGFDTNWKKPA